MNSIDNQPGAIPLELPQTTPQWFLDNIATPGESVSTRVDGRSVHMLTWNWDNAALPALLFVHGFAGHAHWWSFLAPFFIPHYRIAAIDLPGMGDSESPPAYTDSCFAKAIIGCIEQHQLQAVSIIGHSFGGAQSIRAMAMAPRLFSHGIIVDTNVSLPPDAAIRNLEPRPDHKIRKDQAMCIAQFRLMPPQSGNLDAAVQFVAYHSCCGDEHGWHWKFDPGLRNRGEINGSELLCAVKTKVDLIYGEHSMFNHDNKPKKVLEYLSNSGELVIIPDANHHIMIDHPLELVATIKRLLEK